MDSLPNQNTVTPESIPESHPSKQRPRTVFPKRLIGILITIVVVSIILLSLFLMQKKQQTPKPQTTVLAPSIAPSFDKKLQDGPFTCPTISSFCQTAAHFQETALIGSVSANTKIYAAFDGEVQSFIENYPPITPNPTIVPETATLIILSNTKRGLRATYRFQGGVIPKTQVKEGEVLATAYGTGISSTNKNGFEFQILRFAKKNGGQYIKLSQKDLQ